MGGFGRGFGHRSDCPTHVPEHFWEGVKNKQQKDVTVSVFADSPSWTSMATSPGACLKVQMMSCGKSRRVESKGTRPRMKLSQRKRKNISRKNILVSDLSQ